MCLGPDIGLNIPINGARRPPLSAFRVGKLFAR
jgi:hypothetical protein